MRNKIKEFDRVILTDNIKDTDLKSGDIGTIVHIYKKDTGYEVEFVTLLGETIAVCSLLPTQVRPIRKKEIAHVREMAT